MGSDRLHFTQKEEGRVGVIGNDVKPTNMSLGSPQCHGAACFAWNQGDCRFPACKYRHVCACCAGDHVAHGSGVIGRTSPRRRPISNSERGRGGPTGGLSGIVSLSLYYVARLSCVVLSL